MNVLVSASAHFGITSDGQLWTQNSSLGYTFWVRYLEVYDQVRLVVRASPHKAPPVGWNIVTGPGIVASPVVDFEGPQGFVTHYPSLRRSIQVALQGAEAIQLRVPCFIGDTV